MSARTALSTDGHPTSLPEPALTELADHLQGDLLRPGAPGYAEARAVWNAMIDKYPALIVRCAQVEDVVTAIRFARRFALPIAVRGGGHNAAGFATSDGGLVIDLSRLRAVHVDPDARIARAGGGATLADLDAATQHHGLATPLGVVSETGIAGLTLGGGMGWLRRKHGLACDNLVGAQLVTADGQVLEVDRNQRPDLLWALRGGGGNFGVVTRFDFALHPVGPTVAFAGCMYPLAHGRAVFRAWRDFMATAPDDISSQALIWSIPAVDAFPAQVHGEPVAVVVALHSGPAAAGEAALGPLRELGPVLVDLSGPAPYQQVQQLYDPFFPAGELHAYWKSLELSRLDDEVIDAVVGYGHSRPTPETLLALWHLGGAMSRVAAQDSAYGDRSAPYLFSFDTTWKDPADTERAVRWTREAWSDMHRFSGGGVYLNFPGLAEEGRRLAEAAYGSNHARLARIKHRYDPDNVFRLNVNIAPEAG